MITRTITFWTLLFLLLTALACAPNERIISSAAETPAQANATPVVGSFESDLQSMRNADFKFILVFRRNDGAEFTADDKAFANTSTGYHANRRRLADDGKALIIGSNFPFLPGMLEKLNERFTMENYSKPDSGPMISNSVTNK
ncbi:MAG: hypothetical protein ABIU09_03255 [Pyrinomonadaceae bacterium]